MPITGVTVENFKGIQERVEVDLKPITILFGANSAGKSTLLQAMLYLKELLDRQNLDADRLEASGTSIDLGGFRQFVHRHDLSRTVAIGIGFRVGEDGLPVYTVPGLGLQDNDKAEDLLNNGLSTVKDVYLEVGVKWDEDTLGPQAIFLEISLNGVKFAKLVSTSENMANLEYCNSKHPVLLNAFSQSDLEDEELPSEIMSLQNYLNHPEKSDNDEYSCSIPLDNTLIPSLGKLLLKQKEIVKLKKGSFDKGFSNDFGLGNEEEFNEFQDYALSQFLLSHLIIGSIEVAISELKNIRYIGPLRAVPERNFNVLRSPQENRWADGIAAWDLLYKAAYQDDKNGLIKKVSNYISSGNKLDLGYEMEFCHAYEVESNGFALNTLKMLANTAEDEDVEIRLRQVIKEITESTENTKILLRDLRKQSVVSPCDIGVGVSQVIPVVVSALAGGASITAVEQPELHLHPAVQARLGDLFINTALSAPENRFILETHSENAILRILRRIRETTTKKNDSTPTIGNDDIQLIFVQSIGEKTDFMKIRVDKHGQLLDEIPSGFFEESFDELF